MDTSGMPFNGPMSESEVPKLSSEENALVAAASDEANSQALELLADLRLAIIGELQKVDRILSQGLGEGVCDVDV